jgi:hypothetical protein
MPNSLGDLSSRAVKENKSIDSAHFAIIMHLIAPARLLRVPGAGETEPADAG